MRGTPSMASAGDPLSGNRHAVSPSGLCSPVQARRSGTRERRYPRNSQLAIRAGIDDVALIDSGRPVVTGRARLALGGGLTFLVLMASIPNASGLRTSVLVNRQAPVERTAVRRASFGRLDPPAVLNATWHTGTSSLHDMQGALETQMMRPPLPADGFVYRGFAARAAASPARAVSNVGSRASARSKPRIASSVRPR